MIVSLMVLILVVLECLLRLVTSSILWCFAGSKALTLLSELAFVFNLS